MLKIGELAPEFELPNGDGDIVKLRDLRGKKVVLFFYPKDSTSGCTKQAIGFSEKQASFEANNTIVLGVSRDSQASHQKFSEKFDLTVQLLSDSDSKAIEAYGVWQEKMNYGKKYMGIVRTTFLIDESGIVEDIWNKVRVTGHVDKVFDVACSVKSEKNG